jgi:hypothetical protein
MNKPRKLSNLRIFESLTQTDLEKIEQMAVTTNVWPKNTFIQKPESKSGWFVFVLEEHMSKQKSIFKLLGKLARILVGLVHSEESFTPEKTVIPYTHAA